MNRIVTGLLVLLIVALLFSAAWLARPVILRLVFGKVQDKLENSLGLELSAGDIEVMGWKTIRFENLVAQVKGEVPLFQSDTLLVKFELLPLLSGRLKVEQLEMAQVSIKLESDSSQSNFMALFRKRKKAKVDTTERGNLDLAVSLNRVLQVVFDALPDKLQIRNSSMSLRYNEIEGGVSSELVQIQEGMLEATFLVRDGVDEQFVHLKGTVDDELNKLETTWYSDEEPVRIPFLEELAGGSFSFDTLVADLSYAKFEQSKLQTAGLARLVNLHLDHPRISEQTVEIGRAEIDYLFTAAGRVLRLDSGSKVLLNDLPFDLEVALKVSSQPRVSFFVATPYTEADSFFSALPSGLFPSVQGMNSTGKLSYRLYADLDFKQLDSLKFQSSLLSKQFRISKYGKAYIPKLAESFEYTTQDPPYRTVWVGPENSAFTTIDLISPYLKNCILTSEDASFFYHRGFNEEAFRKSIITNIRKRKFARGGSTITMQLVKNVFLSRKKTIARKLDETLLVWLIEHNRLVSKNRLFEVYLNIIEWAPGVYGVGEAAPYYFSKTPAELSLSESIYLSSIIPKPKAFRYSFDGSGNLKPYLAGYYRLLTNIMLRRNLIDSTDTTGLSPNVILTGPARSKLVLTDTLASDSLLIDEEDAPALIQEQEPQFP